MLHYRNSACAIIITASLFIGTQTASAGVPECNDLRLEDVGSCEVQASAECEASCGDVGVYKKACATKLHTVCREECVLDPEPTCTDSCTETCTADCDIGINITCIHNCFAECSGSCSADCEGASDPEQCVATCEANCDGECDIKCRPLVDGDCYKHCIECCDGSCTAQASMTCQQSCQEEQFEDCEYEIRADCDASCSASGALFCDGEYAISGAEIPRCAQALLTRGVQVAEFEAEAQGKASADVGCSATGGPAQTGPWLLWVAACAWILGMRGQRHRRS